MAKDLSRHQEGIVKRYYEHQETIQSTKLSEIVSDLWLAEGTKAKQKLWGKAQIALMRLGVNPTRVANVIGKEDLEELAKLVAEVDAGSAPKGEASDADSPDAPKQQGVELAPGAKSLADGRTIGEARADRAAAGGYDSLEADNLKRALRAFRKKLKSIRRDDESRLGGRYTSMGRKSKICAIQPPNEYPQAVWAKLVELKRLKKAGQGTFELPDQ